MYVEQRIPLPIPSFFWAVLHAASIEATITLMCLSIPWQPYWDDSVTVYLSPVPQANPFTSIMYHNTINA